MPRFYFHLDTPKGRELDDFGVDYPDLDRAYIDVCRTVPVMSGEIARKGGFPLSYVFVIADEAGTTLMEVPFAEPMRAALSGPTPSVRTRRLSREIAQVISEARATTRRAQDILARARSL